jgi:small subunit ribosomal protein S2
MIFYLNSFINYTVHIGHKAKNSLLLSSWFFYKLRKKIWIINIIKTIIFLKIVFKYIAYLVNNKLPIWFINLEITRELIFKKFSTISGEYYCTRIWVRGLLSNYKNIQESLSKYKLKQYIVKKENKNILIKNWILTRFSWPRSLFVANVLNNYIVIKEASSVSIPIIAMVDTNIKSFLFHFPIPSNDDSIQSICYIINLLTKKILIFKYKKLILWYIYYKSKKKKSVIDIIDKIKKNIFIKVIGKKYSKLLITDTFYKFRKNINFLFKRTINKKQSSYFFFDVTLYKWLKGHLAYYKRLANFYCFYNKIFYKFKFKNTHNYKKFIKNFIKLDKFNKTIKKQPNRYIRRRKKIFLKYYLLSNFYLKKFFNATNNVSDIYYENKFVNLAFLLNIYRWISMQKRYHLSRYFKRSILHYWLVPNFVKFHIRNSKKKNRKFFQSRFYPEERSTFTMNLYFKIRRQRREIKPLLKRYYHNWFFFLLKKI